MASNAQTRSRRDHGLWDARVNELWGGQMPILSPQESLAAARKLYRHAMGRKARKWKWELTGGNRRTWARRGIFYVNPDERAFSGRGLREIIHSISHYCHWRLHPADKPHSIRQLRLEAKLTKFALARRWHEGTLKHQPKPEAPAPAEQPKPDKVQLRYRRMVARLNKWEAELERAKRLHAKARREVRTYELRHKNRVAA